MSSSGPEPWIDGVREGIRRHERERSTRSRYEMLGELGSGAMGVVYRARDLKLDRTVALKVLQSTNSENAKRFVREGHLAAQLSHPHIVPVYELGELDGRQFIAMELVQGTPLQGRRLEPRQAATVLRDVAEAVHYAHGQGIIHRDLKPENVMLSDDGHVWVMDFGLARPLGRGRTMTATGTVMGTPNYMPPEQADGERCDARSDIYSLGATLWALLVGRPPFEAPSALAVLDRVRMDEIVPPPVDRDLVTIVRKAMEKAAEKRYASAQELADDLKRYLEGVPILAAPTGLLARIVREVRRHPTFFAVVAGAIAILLAAPAYSLIRSRGQAAERNRLLQEAGRARVAQEWSKAASLYAQASKSAPDDASIQDRRRSMEEMSRCVRALADRDAFLQRAHEVDLPKIAEHDPASKKERRWRAEEEFGAAKREAFAHEQEAEQAALAALTFDPTLEEARRRLADLYVARYEEALPTRDRETIAEWGRRALIYGGAEALSRWRRPATLALTTRPASATAFVFRYEERRRRLIPLPCNASGETLEIEVPPVDALPRDAREEAKSRARDPARTAYPLHATPYNQVSFPIRLPPGSYLILLRKDGFADAVYPALLESGGRVDAQVRLIRPKFLPSGFVYVPAGPSIFGADPQAPNSPEAETSEKVPGFLIARYSVTAAEYLEFLNDLPFEEAIPHCPRSPERRAYWEVVDKRITLGAWNPDEPVLGVSWEDASVYAEGCTRRRGDGKWKFRLPTEDEWVRAARGADRRCFPWGDRFDPAFAAVSLSRIQSPQAASPLERIGLFPADESPFGVRDMAGVVANWTSSSIGDPPLWISKGGVWNDQSQWSRIAARNFLQALSVNLSTGIRLAADVPQED